MIGELTNQKQGTQCSGPIISSLPHPQGSGAYRVSKQAEEEEGFDSALRERLNVERSRQRLCSNTEPSYSEYSPGPSPLKQERPGCLSACLHPPLSPFLHRLSAQLLQSHAWVLGRGEWLTPHLGCECSFCLWAEVLWSEGEPAEAV